MWKLTDLNEKKGPGDLFQIFEHYVLEKNLNFIVAREKCINLRQKDLGPDKTATYLKAFAACDFSMISLFNGKPKAPFISANMAVDQGLARVQFLIDLTDQASAGRASPFYSKILGAFATHFFAAQPQINKLWFPFTIEDIVGSKMAVHPMGFGTVILR
ncbi:MAG: hypothetical protein KKC20_04775 [Proteobacteria bacterium]|nr:hypothetical protein [Pseudomonadota bacterium]